MFRIKPVEVTIKHENLLRAVFYLICICECYGFKLLTISVENYRWMYFLLSVLMFLVVFSRYAGTFTFKYTVVFFTLLVLDFVYADSRHPELSIRSYVSYNKHYVLLFTAVPLIYVFIKDAGIHRLFSTLSNLVTVTMFLAVINAFVYNTMHRELFNYHLYVKEIYRAGRLRMWDLSSLEILICLYLFHSILYRKKKLLSLLKLVICIAALIYVEQTRTTQMILLLLGSLELFFYPGRTEFGRKILLIIKMAAVCGLIYSAASLTSLIYNYFTSIESSVTIRQAELKYAISPFLKGELLGEGLVDRYYLGMYKWNGELYELAVTDIGIFGLFYQAGILLIPMYIWPIIRMGIILIKGRKQRCDELWVFLTLIYVYLLMTSFSLIILNSPRFLAWPICLALFEYYDICYLKGENKDETKQVKRKLSV